MATTQDRFPFSKAPVKRIKAVQFSVWDPDEIKKYSVCRVDSAEIYEKGKPKAGGLSDPRMGTMDKFGGICTTDGANMYDCPGYFGHIELAKPMFHSGFIKTVVRVLRCVSYHDSKLLLDKSDPKYALGLKRTKPEARLRYFMGICGSKKFDDRSGAPQPKYRLDSMKILMEFPVPKDPHAADAMPESERKQELSAERAYEILRRISDDDCKAMGFDVRYVRPDWMIITNLPVPPPPVRPSVMMDSSARCEDDLTHKLIEIVRANNHLKRQLAAGTAQHLLNDFVAMLQYHITTYMDNTLPGQPPAQQKSGRPIKSISQRLKGKQGRIRGNLMGKRVDFSARTVITGDPNIGIDELGVPWSIALNLTFPETVTPFNRDKLQELVNNGPHPPPGLTGAKSIIRADGRRINLAYVRSDADRQLELGDRVERHLSSGDLVLFNRQPSLHKMSMMGHRGGWDFLNMDKSDSEDEGEASSEGFQPSDEAEEEDDESSDYSSDEDLESEGSDDDEDASEEGEEDEGLSWEELEEEARRDDRQRDLEEGNEEDERPRKRGGGGGGGPAAKRRR
ncbi:DNA-directed RNA polymerase II subunit 1 [Raphidocelis subcapitata]|uniref:DNA-directed RNA polymerase subunit n=1 Tax=Raphidocelis subcapitata TaxID=307507 RepID=A0A2V0NLK0_9CHLO|nr:DNA-directed RNA polymerase II subunit 1 [Raphidocelis subcapitata]|eukprot:GBF88296.1 DNA-directed RNA polymerase II subunit 1 [Raphidocelis subcapitata]